MALVHMFIRTQFVIISMSYSPLYNTAAEPESLNNLELDTE